MKVLVLGSKSFLSQEIKQYFCERNFFYIDRKTLDLENKYAVDSFFEKNYFDIVINTCVAGGKRDVIDTFQVLNSNILIFNNLLNNSKRYGKLFNFCSGAAFDRATDIREAKEEEIFLKNPKDYYGLSKNIISRESVNFHNIYTFRIFGCFGKFESDNRFIKNSVNRIKNKEGILIIADKYMDYISADDLCRVLEFYMLNEINYRDINLTYGKKIKLSDIAKNILIFKKSDQDVTIQDSKLSYSYTGDNSKLDSLNIKIKGLEKSLEEILCQI